MSTTTTSEYFGGCPQCGKNDGFTNIGREHWFYCAAHRARWCLGSNLFSGWREETEATWRCNAEFLAGFAEVEPIMPSRPANENWQRTRGNGIMLAASIIRKGRAAGLTAAEIRLAILRQLADVTNQEVAAAYRFIDHGIAPLLSLARKDAAYMTDREEDDYPF
jgi:hypothetical protein